jgi:hypothetical protein
MMQRAWTAFWGARNKKTLLLFERVLLILEEQGHLLAGMKHHLPQHRYGLKLQAQIAL